MGNDLTKKCCPKTDSQDDVDKKKSGPTSCNCFRCRGLGFVHESEQFHEGEWNVKCQFCVTCIACGGKKRLTFPKVAVKPGEVTREAEGERILLTIEKIKFD
jgi:hypothetical protein